MYILRERKKIISTISSFFLNYYTKPQIHSIYAQRLLKTSPIMFLSDKVTWSSAATTVQVFAMKWICLR